MDVNIKKMLSFLVVVALVFTMVPATGVPAAKAEAAEEITHPLVLDENGEAPCDYCNIAKVKWTPITTNFNIEDGASHHYYLASDVTDIQNYQQFIYMKTPASGSNKLCLNLNGYTLTTCRKITVESGHLNIIGGEDGKIVFTNPYGRNFDGINATGGTVNIYGGTYSYSVEEGQTKKAVVATSRGLTLRGATINGGIILSDTANAQVLLREATNIENISFVGTHGKVTVDTNWTGSANIALPADSFADGVVESRVVANGAFSGKLALSTGEPLKYESSQLVLDKTFNPANAKNYCEVCDGFFAWSALAADTVLDDTVAHHHVYLADNLSTNVDKYLARTADSDVCFNTNGKTLTLTAGRLWNAKGATINIFGGGTIHGVAKEAVNAVWSTTNVYDCTITTDNRNSVVSSSGSAVYNLYAGARVERVAMSQGVVNLYGDSCVNIMELQSAGKMVIQGGWSGHTAIYLNGVTMVDNAIPTTNATVAGVYTGTVSLQSGEALNAANGALVSGPVVPTPLTWEAINAIPVATDDMTEEQLRQICIDYMRMQVSFFWRPSHRLENYHVTGELYDTVDPSNVYRGTPYQGGKHASLYAAMHFYDSETGIMDLSGGMETMALISNQCSSSVSWAWNRVCTSATYGYTQNCTQANGCLRVGPYTYDNSLTDYRNITGGTQAICEANGVQVMYQSYAAMKPADGVVNYTTAGHNMMITEVHVVKNADGTINGTESYVRLLDKANVWTAMTAPNGDPCFKQGFLDDRFRFEQLYQYSYLPFTFAELNKDKPVEESWITLAKSSSTPDQVWQNGATITPTQLTDSCLVSNYGLSDFTITIKDANGNVVWEKWCTPYTSRHVLNSFKTKIYFKTADHAGLPAGANNTVEINVRLGSGELVTAFSGNLSV